MEKSLTPVIEVAPEPRTMDFPDAIKHVIQGKKVARISWGNPDYIFLKDEWLTLSNESGYHTLLVSQGDLEGQDWVVVTEENAN